jgi:hypothetical protein
MRRSALRSGPRDTMRPAPVSQRVIRADLTVTVVFTPVKQRITGLSGEGEAGTLG